MSNGDEEADQEDGQAGQDAGDGQAGQDAGDGQAGQDAGDAQAGEDAPESAEEVGVESLDERLESAESDLESAETEADLDEVDATLEDIAADLESADLPEPEGAGDDEAEAEAEGEELPGERLESRLEELRGAVEEARGPYAEDVADAIESAAGEIRETRWTETGEDDVASAVETFLEAADEHLDEDVATGSGDPEDRAATLSGVAEAVRDAGLDPDDDADTIDALQTAAEDLSAGLEEAETWDDLTVREQLAAQGFYDRLTSENRRDFPPELNVVRIAERENDPDRVLEALETLGSDFMEENCIDALVRMGPPEAYDAMIERAQKRDKPAVAVLGKIGDDRAVETLLEFIQDESNPPLQRVTLEALGEIGSKDATQTVANRLVADDHEVRSTAARALGRIGDTRAIAPLTSVLDEADQPDEVRASAAWALVQIGTEPALEAAAEHADDHSYLVQHEAEKAADALPDEEAEATA